MLRPSPELTARSLVLAALLAGPVIGARPVALGAGEPDLATGLRAFLPVDSDGDGVADVADCAPADGTTWSVPLPVALAVRHDAATGDVVLSWRDVRVVSGPSTRYDVVAGTGATFTAADCLAVDLAQPGLALAPPDEPIRLEFRRPREERVR